MNRELVFEGGYGYRLSDDASLLGVSACDSTSAIPGCFYYNYAGSSPELDGGATMSRRTHMAGTSLAYPISPRVFLGSSVKYFNFKSSDVMTEPKASGFNWDVGATFRVTDLVSVGTAGYNLWCAESAELPRAVGGGVLCTSAAIARGPSTRGGRSTATPSATALAPSCSCGPATARAGCSRRCAATTASRRSSVGGLGYATMKVAIDVAARFAVSGPTDTMFIASMRFFGPRLTARGTDIAE